MPDASTITNLLLIAWLTPLCAFVVAAIAPTIEWARTGKIEPRLSRTIAQMVTGSGFLTLLAVFAAGVAWSRLERDLVTGHWLTFIELGGFRVTLGCCVDNLALLMSLAVCLVASCVHVYAYSYLGDELNAEGVPELEAPESPKRQGRLHRFYQHLALFQFSMLGLVLSNNLLTTYLFWELVGACSFLLIGFYYERPAAATAANKAMLFNRLGDVGMLLGVLALWSAAGTLQYHPVGASGAESPEGLFASVASFAGQSAENYQLILLAGLGVFCGCIGKSAQAPLMSWLPDAMQGPTPVSALVHSATMVAAGVFLVGRLYPILTPETLACIASVGAVTLLLGAIIAVGTNDLKRVLAYSTISQLGYMMLGLGVLGWSAALFHLLTHAAFKALLFLSAGAVIHATHTGDLRRLGGLRTKIPMTCTLMTIGFLALIGAGVPYLGIGLSGYYSKDAIIEHAMSFTESNPAWSWLFWTAVGGAVLTAYYSTRTWLLVFAGKTPEANSGSAHDPSGKMLIPMAVLALLAVVLGWSVPGNSETSLLAALQQQEPHALTVATSESQGWGLHAPGHHEGKHQHLAASLWATSAMLLGVITALVVRQLASLRSTPGTGWTSLLDRRVFPAIDRLGVGAGRRTGQLFGQVIDPVVIDGSLNLATWFCGLLGHATRRLQTGNLRQYVVILAVSVVILGSLAMGAVLGPKTGLL